MINTVNYIHLIELFIALFILLVFSFFTICHYFFKKLNKKDSLKDKEENLKNLETKIDEIKNITRNLNLRYIDTQEFLARNESNYKKIFDFLLSEISKIRDLETENNKLLNIINRKTAKYKKHGRDEV